MTPSPNPRQPSVPKVDIAALRVLVEPVVVAYGLELVDVEWQSTHHGQVLRVTIERPLDDGAAAGETAEGAAQPAGDAVMVEGVSLEDCVKVSRDLSTVLDVEGALDARYNLEVSSPGLDRPLRNVRDFRRQVGRLAKVKLLTPATDGQVVLRGTITGVEGDEVSMTVDGKPHRFAIDQVETAKLVFELPTQSKKTSSKQAKKKRPRRA